MLLVTGGAGFIGSNFIASLNEAGRTDIVVNDTLGTDDKWRNLSKRQVADVVPPEALLKWLDGRELEAIVHFGAISDTTANDADLVMSNNFKLPMHLLDWCTEARTRFIYASSAATYGDGSGGFDDDWSPEALKALKPMNLYGWSKHMFDMAVVERFMRKENLPPQWVGMKFFNVFGPNEYHKGKMASVVHRVFDEAKAGHPVRLFKSHKPGIEDGDQRRDFIYVEDAIAVTRWLLDTPSVQGIFNIGTGKARSFRDMITAMFRALDRKPNIEYIDMPETIRGQYQYFTEARVENLRRAGYNGGFSSLEDSVGRYVTQYLDRADRYR